MFKSNLSPLNPAKEKYSNNNYPLPPNDMQNLSSHHQSAYQYKGMYTQPTNYKPEMTPSSTNYNAPLSPLSPNITKNPISPTAKIKMFSNTLTLNKKPSLNTNPSSQQNNTPDPQPKIFSKMGAKNLTLNLNESIDLKCDEVLEVNEEYIKQTPQQQPVKQTSYGKRTGNKIPALNLNSEIDDLKCDQVLEIRKNDHDEGKRNLRFNNVTSHANYGNHNINQNHQVGLTNHDLENNFSYNNMGNKNYQQLTNNTEKTINQPPLTPKQHNKKPLIIPKRKNPDFQTSNNSNSSSDTPLHQKPRSFTNIISPHPPEKHYQNNEQQNESKISKGNHSIQQSLSQQRFEEMKKLFLRTNLLLEAYKKEVDHARQKLNEVQDKNSFLEKENLQLRKCLYEEGSNSGRNHYGTGNYQLTPGTNRYQGVK